MTTQDSIAGFFARAGGVRLRSYQEAAARAIVDSVLAQRGLAFGVMFPRQSGKNELQAQIEALLLWALSRTDAEIVKVSPTWRPQSLNAMRRLERVLSRHPCTRRAWEKENGYIYRVGRARIFFLSGAPEAHIVGATASTLLEIDEAQDVTQAKYDKEIAPMAASTNATRVFWGTAWTSQTLLARELRALKRLEAQDGLQRVFVTGAEAVAREVPAYGSFVAAQVASLGRNHPLVRTQFFSEEIDGQVGMFPAETFALLQGDHPAQDGPLPGRVYALLVDVAGEAPAGEAPGGVSPVGETPGGVSPAGESPDRIPPVGGIPGSVSPAGESPDRIPPVGGTPACEAHGGVSPAGESPDRIPPEGGTPGGVSPAGETPDGASLGGAAPAGDGGVSGRRDSTVVTVVEVARDGGATGRAPVYRVMARRVWTGTKHTQLYAELVALAGHWRARWLVVDATGVGAGLASFLGQALPGRVKPFIFSQASKSQMGWDFLAVTGAGRWKEPLPGPAGERDPWSALFLRQLAFTRATLLPGPGKTLRWGVPDGTRDPLDGAFIHDDLVLSAALCTTLDRLDWPAGGMTGAGIVRARDPLEEIDGTL